MSSKKEIDSIFHLTEDLAATHKAFRSDEAGTSEVLKAQVAQDFEAVQENGYVIIERLLTASQLELVRDAIMPLRFGPLMSLRKKMAQRL